MEKIGALVVSYGSRGVAIADAIHRSRIYETRLFIADRQRNPLSAKIAEKHMVIPDLNPKAICAFAEANRNQIDFGIVGPEKPIIDGVRDEVERMTGIPMICPTRKYAIEGSKVTQRLLFEEVCPEVNPAFKIFDPNEYGSSAEAKRDLWNWLDTLRNEAVVKPDRPTAGKGVGVWGDHFTIREELYEHFLSNLQHGKVIVEEKLKGEESSFQAFCDGKRLFPLPETRDYKRAFDGDRGPNTGGMGSYKDAGDTLPFITSSDWEREKEIAEKVFRRLKGAGENPEIRGIPLYLAFMHTGSGPKVLEINSRPGDPEFMNIIPILKEDFTETCLRTVEGNLKAIELEREATVVTYLVPPTYGGKAEAYVGDRHVDLQEANELSEAHQEQLRIYPGAMELRDGKTYALSSRTVAVVGVGVDIQAARERSLEGIEAIKGGSLWHRKDIASREHIQGSIEHMRAIRGGR